MYFDKVYDLFSADKADIYIETRVLAVATPGSRYSWDGGL